MKQSYVRKKYIYENKESDVVGLVRGIKSKDGLCLYIREKGSF